MTYFTKEENERLEERIKNNAVEHKNNMFDYYKNNEIKFCLSKERLLKIGEYLNRQLIIHRNVEHDSNWTTEEKMIVELYDFVVELLDYITNLQQKLEVSQTNEETYRLEMLDITKCLGLDEDTIFDEVKEYATNLQKENEKIRKMNMHKHKYGSDMEGKYIIEKAKNKKAIEKLESIRVFGLRSGKTLFSTLINEAIDILNGGDE